jgi:hypothetical protein
LLFSIFIKNKNPLITLLPMKYQNIMGKPSEILALTGYTQKEFNSLLPYIEQGLSESKYTLEGKERRHKSANYKNSAFPTTADKLFFILVYYKQYTSQSMIALTFGISQPKANQWIHFLTPVLQAALSKAKVMPCRNMKDLPLQKGSLFSHDGTERLIQRPKDSDEQKKYYSGKKKAHTVKNNVVANSDCEIIFLSPTVEGKKHDKILADESHYKLPKGSLLLQDTGFQGFKLEDISILQPKKNLVEEN